jgi:hypothetical protein
MSCLATGIASHLFAIDPRLLLKVVDFYSIGVSRASSKASNVWSVPVRGRACGFPIVLTFQVSLVELVANNTGCLDHLS